MGSAVQLVDGEVKYDTPVTDTSEYDTNDDTSNGEMVNTILRRTQTEADKVTSSITDDDEFGPRFITQRTPPTKIVQFSNTTGTT